jgi:exonuclease SbcC
VRAVQQLEVQLERARTAHQEARDLALNARETALDVRERRLLGMAAEMAGSLASGDCCPVCGSCDHPVKAAAAPGAPDEADEKAAQRAVDDAAATEHLRDVEARDVQARLEAARERVDEVPCELAAEGARVAAALETLETERADLDAELAVTLGDPVDDVEQALADLEDRIAALAAEEREARRALDALAALEVAAQALRHAEADLAGATKEAGFATAQEAVDHALDRRTYAALAARADEHDRRLASVRAVLAEPGAAEVAAAELPALGPLTEAHGAALDDLGAARGAEGRWAARRDRLGRLRHELEAAVGRWEPLRRDLDLATRVCALVEGKSADNRLQMRLSAYVLGYRLGQVVAAANTRLALMSDQRYTLEHTGRRGAGETRGGLSLVVRDEWSGEARDPATLSGGETFVVSLALALGLADVVTAEAGGADLGTLFVDEGFGSLDADTLDDVLDVLDALRDGGRVVGVVSHVGEMRDRIPAQLVVSKDRAGSTVAVRC